MKFRTAYSEQVRFSSPSGSRFRKNYIKKGSSLIENGVEDVYDSIQKAAPGNVIEDLIRRARAGDSDAIPLPIDSYADLTKMPKDLLEAHSMLEDAHSKFDALPVKLRAEYNNDFNAFIKASADGSLIDKLKVNSKKAAAKAADKPAAAPSLSAEEVSKLRSMLGGNNNA